MAAKGGSLGKNGSMKAASTRTVASLSRGLRDADLRYIREPNSYRSLAPFRAAFAAAKEQGISPTTVAVTGSYPGGRFPPIRINVEHSGKAHLHDGRHRYAAAREAGATKIRAVVRVYGPRSGVKSERETVLPLR